MGFANQFAKVLSSEWYELDPKAGATLSPAAKRSLFRSQLGVAVAGNPPPYAKLKETSDGFIVSEILGKVVTNTRIASEAWVGHYAICKGYGVPTDLCYYSVTPFNSPGVPSTMEFFDKEDVNKSIVARATIQCEKAKSVFKALLDFLIDVIISWIDSLLDNL